MSVLDTNLKDVLGRFADLRSSLCVGQLDLAAAYISELSSLLSERRRKLKMECQLNLGSVTAVSAEIGAYVSQVDLLTFDYQIRMGNFSAAEALASSVFEGLQSVHQAEHYCNLCLHAAASLPTDPDQNRLWCRRAFSAANLWNSVQFAAESSVRLLRLSVQTDEFADVATVLSHIPSKLIGDTLKLDLFLRSNENEKSVKLVQNIIKQNKLSEESILGLLKVMRNHGNGQRSALLASCIELLDESLFAVEDIEKAILLIFTFLSVECGDEYEMSYHLLCEYAKLFASLEFSRFCRTHVRTILQVANSIVRNLKSSGLYRFEEELKIKNSIDENRRLNQRQNIHLKWIQSTTERSHSKNQIGRNLQLWLEALAFIAFNSNNTDYWNYYNLIWIKECVKKEELSKGFSFITKQLKLKPSSCILLQQGFAISLMMRDSASMKKFSKLLIENL